jgi:endo-1,4-beta-xylanase
MNPTVRLVASWWPRLLAATAVLVVGMALAPAQLAFAAHRDRDLTLGDEGRELGIRIGTAVAFTPMTTDATYAQVLAQQFSAITPENEMKWASIERTQGVLDFTQADAEVAQARKNDQLIRGHNLVWHSQLPAWLTSGTFTNAQLTDILHQHITDEVRHFKGKLFQWDVVNEPFNEDGTFRQTIWFNAIGPSYIADALTWAHQADPHAKLYLNDFNIDGIGPKSDAMLALVRSLRAQDVPIDGVGIEGHLGLQFGFPNMYEANVQRFADAGFDVSLTEADNRMILPVTPALLTQQAQNYTRQLNGCIMVARCVDFTVWEFSDKNSWVPGAFKNQGAADIYDANFVPKPAFDAMLAALVNPVSRVHHHTGGND